MLQLVKDSVTLVYLFACHQQYQVDGVAGVPSQKTVDILPFGISLTATTGTSQWIVLNLKSQNIQEVRSMLSAVHTNNGVERRGQTNGLLQEGEQTAPAMTGIVQHN